MDNETIARLGFEAGAESVGFFTLKKFAELVSDAEAKRMQDEGMVTVGHMREQIAKEREQCAKLFPEPHKEYFGRDIQDAIRARSNP
jgi:hypothetical protein